MNIWAMKKSLAIKHMLLMLVDRLGDRGFEFSDADGFCDEAIQMCKAGVNDISAYIYTYGQSHNRYGLHLEYPALEELNYQNSVEILDDIDFDNLVNLLSIHFDMDDRGNNAQVGVV